jgi:hypothetical protein
VFIVARAGCREAEGEALLTTSESLHARVLPRGCTFSESDWRVLAPIWYPVVFSREIDLCLCATGVSLCSEYLETSTAYQD